MTEPTPEIVEQALARAQKLVATQQLGLIEALAHATTTRECGGVQSYKVFRDAREAVNGVLPDGQSAHQVDGKPERILAVLESARKSL